MTKIKKKNKKKKKKIKSLFIQKLKKKNSKQRMEDKLGSVSHTLSESETLDLGLYSRQIYVLSLEVLIKLSKMDVLVCGLSGLGVEVGKKIKSILYC